MHGGCRASSSTGTSCVRGIWCAQIPAQPGLQGWPASSPGRRAGAMGEGGNGRGAQGALARQCSPGASREARGATSPCGFNSSAHHANLSVHSVAPGWYGKSIAASREGRCAHIHASDCGRRVAMGPRDEHRGPADLRGMPDSIACGLLMLRDLLLLRPRYRAPVRQGDRILLHAEHRSTGFPPAAIACLDGASGKCNGVGLPALVHFSWQMCEARGQAEALRAHPA